MMGGGEREQGNRAGQQKGGGDYHQPYHQHDGWGGNGNRAGQQQGGEQGGGTTSNMMDPIPITNMMGGGGRGSHPYRQHDGLGEKVRAGNYHQHDGSHPYHQNDGWGGEGEQSFFCKSATWGVGNNESYPYHQHENYHQPYQQHDGWGGNGNRGTEQVLSYHQHDGSYPYHQHDANPIITNMMGGGGTGTGEQSRSYPTTNMMHPIPITNIMGGGGNGNRGTEQVSNMGGGGGKQGGNYHQPYYQHDGWAGEREQGNKAGPILPPT